MESSEPVPADHTTTYCRLPGGEQQNQTNRKPSSPSLSSPGHPQGPGSPSDILVPAQGPAQELWGHTRTISCKLPQSDRALPSSGAATLEPWDTKLMAGEHVPAVR